MKKAELVEELQEVLQRDEPLTSDMLLKEMEEWDSLAYISVIALCDQHFGKVLTTYEIEQCQTVGDLIELIYQPKEGN